MPVGRIISTVSAKFFARILILATKIENEVELCYNIYYVEKNSRACRDPWSLRQMAIYYKVDVVTKRLA